MPRTIEDAEAELALALADASSARAELAAERAEHSKTKNEATAAKERARSARRVLRLRLAGKCQQQISALQKRADMPSTWTDGAVLAVEALHAEIERTPDEEEG